MHMDDASSETDTVQRFASGDNTDGLIKLVAIQILNLGRQLQLLVVGNLSKLLLHFGRSSVSVGIILLVRGMRLFRFLGLRWPR